MAKKPEQQSSSSRAPIYLVGHEYSHINGKQVLSVFFFNKRSFKLADRVSAKVVVDEISVFWQNARIPMRDKQHCISKVEKLHDEWKVLHKSSKKDSEFQRKKEEQFCEKLNDLFDIAHANALTMIGSPRLYDWF